MTPKYSKYLSPKNKKSPADLKSQKKLFRAKDTESDENTVTKPNRNRQRIKSMVNPFGKFHTGKLRELAQQAHHHFTKSTSSNTNRKPHERNLSKYIVCAFSKCDSVVNANPYYRRNHKR